MSLFPACSWGRLAASLDPLARRIITGTSDSASCAWMAYTISGDLYHRRKDRWLGIIRPVPPCRARAGSDRRADRQRVTLGSDSKRVAQGPGSRRGSSETDTVRGMRSGYIYTSWPQSGDFVLFNPLQSCKGKPLECFAFRRIDPATILVVVMPASCRQTTPCCGHANFFLKFLWSLPTR